MNFILTLFIKTSYLHHKHSETLPLSVFDQLNFVAVDNGVVEIDVEPESGEGDIVTLFVAHHQVEHLIVKHLLLLLLVKPSPRTRLIPCLFVYYHLLCNVKHMMTFVTFCSLFCTFIKQRSITNIHRLKL